METGDKVKLKPETWEHAHVRLYLKGQLGDAVFTVQRITGDVIRISCDGQMYRVSKKYLEKVIKIEIINGEEYC